MNPTKQIAGLLGVAAGFGAMAAPPAPANGVMEFPNVRVDIPRTPAEQARAASRHSDMMAYKDPATGKLTAPTPEQSAVLTARTRRLPAPGAPATVKRSSHGGVSLTLDDRHERYATASKDANGAVAVAEACALDHTIEGTPGEHHEK